MSRDGKGGSTMTYYSRTNGDYHFLNGRCRLRKKCRGPEPNQ